MWNRNEREVRVLASLPAGLGGFRTINLEALTLDLGALTFDFHVITLNFSVSAPRFIVRTFPDQREG